MKRRKFLTGLGLGLLGAVPVVAVLGRRSTPSPLPDGMVLRKGIEKHEAGCFYAPYVPREKIFVVEDNKWVQKNLVFPKHAITPPTHPLIFS